MLYAPPTKDKDKKINITNSKSKNYLQTNTHNSPANINLTQNNQFL